MVDTQKKEILEMVSKDGMLLGSINDEYQQDKEVINLALGQNGLALQFGNRLIQKDVNMVKVAVGQNPFALQFADQHIRNNKEVVALAVKGDPLVLQFASEQLKVTIFYPGQHRTSYIRSQNQRTQYSVRQQHFEGQSGNLSNCCLSKRTCSSVYQ